PSLQDLRGSRVPPAQPCGDDEPMICTHTSGTTGVPKLVVHSPYTIVGVNSRLETARIPFLSTRPDDVVAACVAFVHVRSITWLAGQLALPPAKAVVLADSDPETVVETLREHRPTTLEACPNIFQRWENLTGTHPELFERVRAFISTFDAIHPRTVRAFLETSKRRGAVWGQSWGQSEVGPVSLAVYTRRKIRRGEGKATAVTTNVGRPVPVVTRVRVVDPQTRRRVRRGRSGLVMVKTKGRCLDYLGETDRHQAKIWDGWWNTGDIGVRTLTGGLRILDREVDVIPGTSGIDLESVLLERLPEASEVVVLGVPGRPPVPVLSVEGDRGLDPERWRAATADLPELDEPVLIDWEDFPRTGTWKVRRPQLRERLFGTRLAHGTGRWT
ncbi:hypothetical protein Arub01_52070, partial [Actinomadura rubrobrunea]